MSKIEKLINRLLSRPNNFTFHEMTRILKYFDYVEITSGKTSGSRKAYIHSKNRRVIRVHKSHPGNELKRYVIEYLINELKKDDLI